MSGREIRRLTTVGSPFSLAITPDGRLLVVGTWPGLVEIWDTESGRKLQILKGPTALVTALDITADGSVLVLSSRDGSTRLWDVSTGQWLATVATRKAGAERVRFFPDGQRIAIGYADGEVEVRDLQYFFRHAAGHAEHQQRLLSAADDPLPRSNDVLEWAHRFLTVGTP